MPEEVRGVSPDQEAEAVAIQLGRSVLARDLKPDEAAAVSSIFKATVHALKHGFIQRLAEHVETERTAENVEEFFEDVIHPD